MAMTRGPDKQFDPRAALEKAMRLFWANGYEGTGMADLQAAMGIGRKSLYDTFGNKRQLFIKAMQLYADTVFEEIRLELDREGSPLDSVRRVLRKIEKVSAEPKSCGCLFGIGIAHCDIEDDDMSSILRGHMKKVEDAFARAFTRARDADEIGDRVLPRDLARMFMSIIQGLALIGRVTDSPALPKSIVNAALSTLEAA